MRIALYAATMTAGLILSGCMSNGNNNRSLDSIHQPVVSVNNYVLDADTSNGVLSPVEARRVNDWLDAIQVGYGDQIAIDDSATGGNSRAARDTVAMMLARKGLLLSANAPVTGGAIRGGSIRVVVTRATARVPGCPDWSSRSSSNVQNATSSNYGCATNANLAAMVADANDLIQGQSSRNNDPQTASRAIEAYRAATPTGAGGLGGGGGGDATGGNSSGGGQ